MKTAAAQVMAHYQAGMLRTAYHKQKEKQKQKHELDIAGCGGIMRMVKWSGRQHSAERSKDVASL